MVYRALVNGCIKIYSMYEYISRWVLQAGTYSRASGKLSNQR